jgi:hypothetical protein
VYAVRQNNENRILLTRGNSVLVINPMDLSQKTLEVPGNPARIWAIPAIGNEASGGAVWVVGSHGRVYLTNADLDPVQGFPRITGLRITTAPAAWDGKLYLTDFSNNEASVHVIDEKGSVVKWPRTFDAAIQSPLSFISFQNTYFAACYPKEFFANLWLLDNQGNALPGWPVPVFGIAFGSPLLFIQNNSLNAAFVTQAGELSVYDEGGRFWPAFPLELDGIFYVQPVFDGEFLWLIASDGTLFQVSPEGNILSHKIPNLEVMEEGRIVAMDVDRSKKPAIFISGEGNALYGFSRNFQSLEGFPLPIWGRPAFMDLNGKIAIAGAGMDNRVYLWQFN